MRTELARAAAWLSTVWDRYKRPVKRTYQIPAVGAAYVYRRMLRRPVFVGVTGSLGKTQLKSLIAAVMAKRGPVRFDPGTDNRTYDAAKNLLCLRPSDTACIQEIGLAGPGTMARPVRLFRPDISVITNIRSDHFAGFVSRHDHVLEKATIIRSLPKDGWAILNADEPDLDILIRETKANVLTYGVSEHANVRAVNVVVRPPKPIVFQVRILDDRHDVATKLHGAHNVHNVLAAIAVGHAADLSLSDATRAIENVQPISGRMQYVEHADGVRFLLDDFKASVGSLGAVVDYLRAFEADGAKKILVLGSIAYGDADPCDDYVGVIEAASEYCDDVLLVGAMASAIDRRRLPPGVEIFETTKQCADRLLPRLRPRDLIVLKCSNGDDHLRRLEISRRATVNCWQMKCMKKSFCDECRFVNRHLN